MKKGQVGSIGQRMKRLVYIIMVPMTLLSIYLIATLAIFNNSYNQAIENLAKLNDYSMNFKQDLDYSIYQVIIGSVSFEELKEKREIEKLAYAEKIKNPYIVIQDMREMLLNFRSTPENERKAKMILKTLGYLEKVVNKIEESDYSKSVELLNNDVYTSTSLLKDNLQELINRETAEVVCIQKSLHNKMLYTIFFTVCAMITVLALLLNLSQRITRSVTEPVRELCTAMQQATNNEFRETLEVVVDTEDEIRSLIYNFNNMTSEIEVLIDRIRQEQKNLRKTELKLLQAQINPHFLYNTLDAIVWMAEGGQNLQVVTMVSSLSEFFRTVLSNGKDSITIGEEEKHIRSYLTIENIRYQDILEYEINFEKSILNCFVIKLTLQPLIENALYHGIKNKRGKGKISVKGYEKDGDIWIEIIDNGIGMGPEELDALRKKIRKVSDSSGGFGLANVEERIRLNYGPTYGMSFESRKMSGTKVTIHIPKIIKTQK